MNTFMGYERTDGTVGVRNHIAILSNVACANAVAQHIADAVPGAMALCHGHGCGRKLERRMHTRTLIGLGAHPNVYGTVLVSLGCEGTNPEPILTEIAQSGRPVVHIRIQDTGSTAATQKGIEAARELVAKAAAQERKAFPAGKLMLGLECGGSDALSGVTANPAIGVLSDWLVEQGGTTVLTEMTELIGTTHILGARAANEEVRRRIEETVAAAHANAVVTFGPHASRAIAPGNQDGGMSTIQEKALGCVRKGGSSPIMEVVDYAQKPSASGLVIMDGPGYDAESLPGLAGMGCQIIIFSTGRGNPLGFPTVPVIKVASNTPLAERMRDDIDLDAGKLLQVDYNFDDALAEYSQFLLEVASGKETKAELNRQGGLVSLHTFSRCV